jgi:HSP20 family protein
MGAAVAFLTVAVCVQGYYLYTMRAHVQQANAEDNGGYQLITGMQRHGANTAPQAGSSNSTLQPVDPFFNWSPFGSSGPDPFQNLSQMRQQMDQLFNQAFGSSSMGFGHRFGSSTMDLSFSPKVDMTEDAENYIVTIDAPGTDKSNLDVKLEDRTLTISGKRDKTVAKQDGGKVIQQERMSGEFQRAIVLPGPVKEGSMNAKYDNGVLKVTIKKADEPKVRDHIQVQ